MAVNKITISVGLNQVEYSTKAYRTLDTQVRAVICD